MGVEDRDQGTIAGGHGISNGILFMSLNESTGAEIREAGRSGRRGCTIHSRQVSAHANPPRVTSELCLDSSEDGELPKGLHVGQLRMPALEQMTGRYLPNVLLRWCWQEKSSEEQREGGWQPGQWCD